MSELIMSDDCGTTKGIRLPADEDMNVVSRILAQPVDAIPC